ncbi:hypothetical protein D3C74_159450 [compost metagenome]
MKKPSIVSSYVGQLKESGLFETNEKVSMKLKVINALVGVIERTDIDLHEEVDALTQSLLLDLGVPVLKDGE